MATALRYARNDIRQYDDLAAAWWDLRGPFAMLHWIAAARASLIPPAVSPGSRLLDVACGAGLLAPHIADKGYEHIGVDLTVSALEQAEQHGVKTVEGDAVRLPFEDNSFEVVCAGEILEHVADVNAVVDETCRVLKPGGTVVVDTIANTRIARLLAITVAERINGGAPKGLHDHRLFVDRNNLVNRFARNGVQMHLNGLRPAIVPTARWLRGKQDTSRMVPTRFTSVLFQGVGRKA